MPNLDNLITKILSDSDQKAGQIIEAANADASEIVSKKALEGEKEKDRILGGAREEADKSGERILLDKKLEIRDDILAAKRKTINKVFESALEKLNNMPREDFIKYLRGSLSGLQGGELILPEKYAVKLEELSGSPENINLSDFTLYNGGRRVDGGFILIKGGIEHNRTFEALLEYRRQELESEIVKILF